MYNNKELREEITKFIHYQEVEVIDYVLLNTKKKHGGRLIPQHLVTKWNEEKATDYEDLPETEKLKSRLTTDILIHIFNKYKK